MSKILFTKEDIRKLEINKNVLKVSKYSITYSYEFKILFIDEYIVGKLPRQIFEENGFDINIIGYQRIKESSHRWRASYKKDGILGLEDTRKTVSGSISRLGRNVDDLRQLCDFFTDKGVTIHFIKEGMQKAKI